MDETVIAAKPRKRAPRRRRAVVPAPSPAGFAPLVTERLTLRPPIPEDAESLHRLINDWEVTRMLARVPFPYEREEADKWITSAARELEQGSAYHLVITGSDDGQEILVGCVGLQIDGKTRVGRLGYWVGRRFWRHGVATEAAGRMTRWAFANLTLDRIEANVAMDNAASVAVLRRIGFRQVGEGREHSRACNAERPVWRFEATRDDVFGHTDLPAADEGAKPLLMVAACALIDSDGRVLLARRPEGKAMAGLWEFPGGKLQPGETPEAALIRELKEELGIDVSAGCLAPFTFASHDYERFHLLMPLYLCRRWKGLLKAREGQTLAWVRPQKLAEYPMPPADKPLVPLLRDFL